jgi:peptidyl-prolyl cis-trans isomerase C
MFSKTARPSILVSSVYRFAIIAIALSIAEGRRDEEDELKRLRVQSKSWYVKNIEIGGVSLPVSPVTVAVVFLSVFYLFYYWSGKQSYAEASHILLKDPSEESKKRMEGWKKKIGNDYALFSKYATDYSECPSKHNGGKLGRFRKNDMAPTFDRACFDPTSELRTTIGPIQTQFGWHLIYVQDRQIPE